MSVRKAYDAWSAQYDSNTNRTRDVEAIALREALQSLSFANCLEVGCGTGKNTQWLATKCNHVTGVDLSAKMIDVARAKITSSNVSFIQADITTSWSFAKGNYDLITFSLVLEHIENLGPVFEKASNIITKGGTIYIGELHPFKQYNGTKARFDVDGQRHVVECYNHHVSDFIKSAKEYGLSLIDVNEFFDENNREDIPRILTILLGKQ